MAFSTTDARTELGAVNEILAAIGQAPVTTLEQTNPDVAICYNTLIQISREVQSQGWAFNIEREYPLTPDVSNEISVPNNYLRIDLSPYYNINRYEAVIRNGKLYNKSEHTYIWTESTVYVDIIWFFTWEDLPAPIQDYIISRAASVTSQRLIGDNNQYELLKDKEASTLVIAQEYETQQGEYTMFGRSRNGSYYQPYQPYQTLMR